MQMNRKLVSRLRGNDNYLLSVIPAKAGTPLRYKFHRHPGLEPGQGFLNIRRKPRPGSPLRCVRDDDGFVAVIPAKAGTQL